MPALCGSGIKPKVLWMLACIVPTDYILNQIFIIQEKKKKTLMKITRK